MSSGSQVPLGQGLDVRCECGLRFAVPPTLRGGLTHCPSCTRLVRVGGADRQFRTLLVLGVLAAFALACFVGAAEGVMAGAVALLVALAILGLLVLAS